MDNKAWFDTNYGCPLCNRLHAIRQCTRFLVMDIERKLRVVAEHALCVSCLAQSHLLPECRSIDRCKRCRQKHNTLLHTVAEGCLWFPMTAQAKLYPHQVSSRHWSVRILIDPNAARSSISARMAKKSGCLIASKRTHITLVHSRYDHKRIHVVCAVEDGAARFTPRGEIKYDWVNRRKKDIVHADVWWYSRDECDVVLGADVVPKILEGPAEGMPGKIYVQKTYFGDAYFGEGVEETDPDYIDYEYE